MTLTFYNTLSRRKEAFEPLSPGQVNIYCCGVTVYDYCHLGHARSYIVWDTVRRYLQWRGYQVRYVQNFTDIDDKIIRRSQEQNLPWSQITQTYIQAYLEDMARLNILPADHYPQATQVIPQIIEFIKTLIDRGYAYPVEGDVYYAVERFPSYGKLSGRQLDQLEAGASGRLEEETERKKRHPLDFALWKSAKPGEPEWDSPWGKGRPGWHIECSVMVREDLGNSIDIHMGGQDLIFPHHENEIAQSEAALAQPLARYWLHNGFVNIGGEKMSKSLYNFITIRALLDTPLDPMVVRLFILQAHYRKPIDFTDEAIASAQNSWDTLKEGLLFGYKFGQKFGQALGWTDVTDSSFGDPSAMRIPDPSDEIQRFQTAMDDDINTPGGVAVLFELAKDLRREGNILTHEGKTDTDGQTLRQQWQTLVVLAQVLGLEAKPETARAAITEAEVEAKIQQRLEARKAKNWAESDRIRDELKAQGVILVDKPGGVTEWHWD